jgi:hypothetical protein
MDYDIDRLRLVASDKALTDAFLHQHRELVSVIDQMKGSLRRGLPIAPFPAADTIRAIQASVFDNGEKKRRDFSRYKIRVHAWTSEVIDWEKPDWGATISLKRSDASPRARDRRPDAVVALTKLKSRKLLTPIVQQDVDDVETVCGFTTHCFIAHQDGDGTRYLNGHFGAVNMVGDDVASIVLLFPGMMIQMPSPSKTTANKHKKLAKKVIAQSRYSPDPSLAKNWATGSDHNFL